MSIGHPKTPTDICLYICDCALSVYVIVHCLYLWLCIGGEFPVGVLGFLPGKVFHLEFSSPTLVLYLNALHKPEIQGHCSSQQGSPTTLWVRDLLTFDSWLWNIRQAIDWNKTFWELFDNFVNCWDANKQGATKKNITKKDATKKDAHLFAEQTYVHRRQLFPTPLWLCFILDFGSIVAQVLLAGLISLRRFQ